MNTYAEDPTYACPFGCLDSGYTLHRPVEVVSQDSGRRIPAAGCTVARFCHCAKGMAVESGFWAEKLRPKKGEKTANHEIKARWLERQRRHPDGLGLRSRVEKLLGQMAKEAEAEQS